MRPHSIFYRDADILIAVREANSTVLWGGGGVGGTSARCRAVGAAPDTPWGCGPREGAGVTPPPVLPASSSWRLGLPALHPPPEGRVLHPGVVPLERQNPS